MNNPTSKNICVYHKDCFDGFTSAWLVYKYIFNEDCYLVPMNYGDKLTVSLTYRNVIIVDFSFSKEILLHLKDSCNSLTVLDHHKTAELELKDLGFCMFDSNKCGSTLVWEYIQKLNNTNEEVPKFIQYIEDRDLWHNKLEFTKEFNLGLRNYKMTLDNWTYLIDNVDEIIQVGKNLTIYLDKKLNDLESVYFNNKLDIIYFEGYYVPLINTTEFISEKGNLLSKYYPFVILYFDSDKRYYSLRSSSVDVSEIAKRYGGGGHKYAAGFNTDSYINWIKIKSDIYTYIHNIITGIKNIKLGFI